MKPLFILVLLGLALPASAAGAPVKLEPLMERLAREAGCLSLGPLTRHTLSDPAAFEPGEAQILAEYGFHDLSRQQFRCRGRSLQVRIYRMLDSPAAYGLFTLYRKPDSRVPDGFPRLAEESDGWIAFAQSHFYVRVQRPAQPGRGAAALEAARVLAQGLPDDWALPSLVEYLPRKHLVAGSEVYVMGHRALNFRIPLGQVDLFGLVHGAEALLADYRPLNGSARLLLMIYPTQQLAAKYLRSGYERLIAQYPDWQVFYKREGPLVVMVLNSTDPEIASSFLDKVSYVSSVSWDPEAEPLSVGRMMLSVFFYVGAVIGITMVAGLLFGLLRVLISWLFPGKIFDRRETHEVIRLKLPPPRSSRFGRR